MSINSKTKNTYEASVIEKINAEIVKQDAKASDSLKTYIANYLQEKKVDTANATDLIKGVKDGLAAYKTSNIYLGVGGGFLLLGVVGGVGYYFYNRNKDDV